MAQSNTYKYENGRRYQAYKDDGTYLLPHDEPEYLRLNTQHVLLRMCTDGQLALAPLAPDKPIMVLDIGTGTGIWAREFVDEYPQATVVGVDLSLPETDDLPARLEMRTGDLEADWSTFLPDEEKFDYIHARMFCAAIKDPRRMLQQAVKHLKPGGWFEWQELHTRIFCACPDVLDIDKCRHSCYWEAQQKLAAGIAKFGIDLWKGAALQPLFDQGGLYQNHQVVTTTPVGCWPEDKVDKEKGLLRRQVLLQGMESLYMGPLTKGLGMEKAEVDELLEKVRGELRADEARHYLKFHTYYGRKPTPG
ncbi:hypothetical protein B0A55_03580 [Friedmanniomyces simplex]|uniref:Methyltransferase domain-containing protein n=1 Tax=Friedmanniomyces simplex TaxID=329884 RepID=A0A4U0XLD1_9PEZI|nr:hypothetical protein B0A55_03580 [Friedmanniomyces simplex]